MTRLTNWLHWHHYRLDHWRYGRRRRRWLVHYAQAITWHSNRSGFEAAAMAVQRLTDDPAALTWRNPTRCALRDLGITEEDLV